MNYRNIAYGILAYYWIIIGMFAMNFPTIFPDKSISFLTAGCVGWLWCDYSQRDSDIATARSRSPRLLTSLGDFSWDGVTDIVNIGGVKCNLYYGNGCNHDGWFERGNIAIVVPDSQTVEVGKNRLVKTKLDRRTPPNLRDRIGEVRATLSGMVEHDVFTVASSETIKLEKQLLVANDQIDQQMKYINSINEIVGNTAMMGNILNPASEVLRGIKEALASNNGDGE